MHLHIDIFLGATHNLQAALRRGATEIPELFARIQFPVQSSQQTESS